MIDPLSQMLGSVRLTGGVFLEARFTAPWCALSQITARDIQPFVEAPGQIIAYHFVVGGRLFCTLEGEPPMEVAAGEAVLMPRNGRHTLGSAPGLPAVSADDLIQPAEEGGLMRIDYGGGGEPLRRPRIDRGQVRLLAYHVAAVGAVVRRGRARLRPVPRRCVPGLARRTQGPSHRPRAGAAPWRCWRRLDTTDRLAREVSMSRSAFNERFTALVGLPPIRYLTRWRLQLAKEKLRDGRQAIAQIAHAVGYDSEVAFNREFGEPPARWRERRTN